MTPEQITALAATGESETLEFKHTTGTGPGGQNLLRHAQPTWWVRAVRCRDEV